MTQFLHAGSLRGRFCHMAFVASCQARKNFFHSTLLMGRGATDRRRAPKRSRHAEVEEDAPPEWIASSDPNTPFGLVPADLQSYMREANAQLTERMHSGDADDVQLLVQAVLSEMNGQELALATDPTCSLVLENMSSMLQEKPLRVLLDRMTGNFVTLSYHRYGSHVLQALFYAVQRTVNAGTTSDSASTEQGVLRSLPDIMADMYEEMEANLVPMLTDVFATHMLRSIIALFSGVSIPSLDDMRSKRSAKYRSKERQKAMVDESFTAPSNEPMHVPPAFLALLYRLYAHMRENLAEDDMHRLVPEATAAPTLSLLLRLEAGLADGKSSMAYRNDSMASCILGPLDQRTDFMESALRDAVATHVLQSALQGASQERLVHFWHTYIHGRVAKLGAHPCANYVVATSLQLLPADTTLAEAIHELGKAGDQLVKNQVTGVLQTAVDRSVQIGAYAADVMQAVQAAFRFNEDASKDDVAKFVPAVLSLHTLKAYTHVQDAPQKRKRDDDNQRMTTQGSILLQRIAQLPAPHQAWLYESLCTDDLGSWCRSSTAAHVVIAALTSKAASFAQRRMLIRAIMPMLLDLCDDAWGSRVADALWLSADGFTKEKMAQLVIKHEKRLLASTYGRFFVRRLRLGVYRKNVDEWKAWAMQEQVPTPAVPTAPPTNPFAFLRTTQIYRKPRDHDDMELERILAQVE